jgi:transcriptional regulator with XRE-family HTH domain
LTGREFRNIRLRLGLTQKALAMRLGVEPNTVWRWENGVLRVSRMAALAMKAVTAEESVGKRSRG